MFFGVGAMKAGTTWLHQYLSAHPQVATGPLKEYHYFNKFHREFARNGAVPGMQGLRRRLALASVLRRAGRPAGRLASLLAALRGQGDYLSLVRGDDPQARVFGDVTRVYGLLGRAAFAEMAASHPDTRFIFIMRDPVDRLWSHVRMRARRLRLEPGTAKFDSLATSLLSAKRFVGRSDYARTITELEAAVPGDRILYLFYEDLFSDASVARLCDFLGIDFRPGAYGERVYEGMQATAPEAWRRAARDRLAPVYDFVTDRFGAAVPSAWHGANAARPGLAGDDNDTGALPGLLSPMRDATTVKV